MFNLLRTEFPALVRTLEDVKMQLRDGTAEQKEKSKKADLLLSEFYNVPFALSLSFLCDIYRVYATASNILQVKFNLMNVCQNIICSIFQTVNVLPHIRYQQFNQVLSEYSWMIQTVAIPDCACSCFVDMSESKWEVKDEGWDQPEIVQEVCSWVTFHSTIRELKISGTFQKFPLAVLRPDLGRTRAAVRQDQAMSLLDIDDFVNRAVAKASDVVDFLHMGLSTKVYDGEACAVISTVRTVLDLEKLVKTLHERGTVVVFNHSWDKFLIAAKEIDPGLDARIDKRDFRAEYDDYLWRMEETAAEEKNRKLSSMELLEMLLDPELKMYQGIETVISILCRAALTMSVEAVVESWVSIMEHHSSKRRPLAEESMVEEVVIAINGPSVVHCDAVVRESLRILTKEDHTHFLRKSEKVKTWLVSKSVDNLRKSVPKNKLML